MKKLFTGLIAVAILAVSLFFVIKHENTKQLSPSLFLPKNVLFYIHQKDLSSLLDDFKKSHLGMAIAGIDLIQTAKDLTLPDKDILLLKKIQDEGSAFIKSPLFNELFGNDFTLALLPVESVKTHDPKEKIQQSLVLITRPRHGARLVDLLASGFDKVLNQTSEKFDEYTIKTLRQEGSETVSFVTVRDLVLISLNKRLIKDCLDRYIKEKTSLGDNDNFKKIHEMFKDPEVFCYCALDSLNVLFEQTLAATDAKRKNILKAELKKWKGMQAAGYGAWLDADRIRDKGIIILDNSKFDPAVREIYNISSGKNKTLAIVPDHVLGYYWTNTMDFPRYWKMYLAGANFDKEKVAESLDTIKKRFGMSLENILGMLGRQGGFMMQEGEKNKFLPLPDFSFFVRVKDEKNFDKFYNKFLTNPNLNIKNMTYKGEAITSIASVSHGSFMRLYAMHNDYFVATTSMSMMKRIIDVMQGGAGLKNSPGFKMVSTGLLEDNNSVAYLRIGDMIKTARELVNWGLAIMAVQNQQDSRRLGIVVDRILNPIFDGLAMYSDFGMHSRISPNLIVVESTTLIKK